MGNLPPSRLRANLIVISGTWGSSFVRETHHRIGESFRVRGIGRVHRHVGAARLAAIAGSTVARLRRQVAVAALESGKIAGAETDGVLMRPKSALGALDLGNVFDASALQRPQQSRSDDHRFAGT